MFCDSGFFRSEKQRKKNVRVARKSGWSSFFFFLLPVVAPLTGGSVKRG
jgi:hypothetical protein